MSKYRGVLMVPTVIEFESEGSPRHITEQALRVARGMGKADSFKTDKPYEPKLMEVCLIEGPPPVAVLKTARPPEVA